MTADTENWREIYITKQRTLNYPKINIWVKMQARRRCREFVSLKGFKVPTDPLRVEYLVERDS